MSTDGTNVTLFEDHAKAVRDKPLPPAALRVTVAKRPLSRAKDYRDIPTPLTKERKDALITQHIEAINVKRAQKGLPKLDETEAAQLRDIAGSPDNMNEAAVFSAVIGSGLKLIPDGGAIDAKEFLKTANIDDATYNQLAKLLPAGFTLQDIRNAAERIRASGGSLSSLDGGRLGSGNMTGSDITPTGIYSGGIIGNFGYDVRTGTVSTSFTQQFYQQHFQQAYSSAGIHGRQTAQQVATILSTREKLSGIALVERTKEVARDTRDKLELDLKKYAPKVANVGREYSDPIIENKKLLDEAKRLQDLGKAEEAAALTKRYWEEAKKLEEKAKVKAPDKLPDVRDINKGVYDKAVEKGLKPADAPADAKIAEKAKSPDALTDAKIEQGFRQDGVAKAPLAAKPTEPKPAVPVKPEEAAKVPDAVKSPEPAKSGDPVKEPEVGKQPVPNKLDEPLKDGPAIGDGVPVAVNTPLPSKVTSSKLAQFDDSIDIMLGQKPSNVLAPASPAPAPMRTQHGALDSTGANVTVDASGGLIKVAAAPAAPVAPTAVENKTAAVQGGQAPVASAPAAPAPAAKPAEIKQAAATPAAPKSNPTV